MSQEKIKVLTDMLNKGILTPEAYKEALEALQSSSFVEHDPQQFGIGNHTIVNTPSNSEPSLAIGQGTIVDTHPLTAVYDIDSVAATLSTPHAPPNASYPIGAETIVDTSVTKPSVHPNLDTPQIIGDHEIISIIGEGGMGKVFRARHTLPSLAAQEGDVAIKVMKPALAQNPMFQERFIREASLGKTIQHPNIAHVHHVYSNPLALVLSYIDGEELSKMIPEGGMSIASALAYLTPIAQALDALHHKGIIHRDIKPENIKISSSGIPVLLDFGIAKDSSAVSTMTQTSMAMGTEAYMAPEQMNAKHVGPAADQYALAMTLYECICGSLPWEKRETSAQVVMRKMTQNFLSPTEKGQTFHPEIWNGIKRALSIDPKDRFTDCVSFLGAISSPSSPTLSLTKNTKDVAPSLVSSIDLDSPSPPTSAPTIAIGGEGGNAKLTLHKEPTPTKTEQTHPKEHNNTPIYAEPIPNGASSTSSNTKLFVAMLAVGLIMVIGFLSTSPTTNEMDLSTQNNADTITENVVSVTSPSATLPSTQPAITQSLATEVSPQTDISNRLGVMGITMVSFAPHSRIEMGSPHTEKGRDDDETFTSATIVKGFDISNTEITQQQYETIMGTNPSKSRKRYWGDKPSNGESCSKYGVGDTFPVHCVSWLDSIKFCNRLSEELALEPVYTITRTTVTRNPNANGFRLPTEVEWIYAARGAERRQAFLTSSASNLCDYANVSNSDTQIYHPDWTRRGVLSCDDNWEALAPVRSRSSVRGLYDMTGNLWEWTWATYSESGPNTQNNASISLSEQVVLRGGAWQGPEADYRLANRYSQLPERHSFFVGFRIARNTE